MREFTKLMLTLALLVVGVGGAKAGKVYASFSVATGCTWDGGTNTFGFTAVDGWQILLTGLPAGDITGYTKFHVTLSSMSDNIENIRLCIKDTDGTQAWKNLVSGENNVDFAAFATANPDCDFKSIADITLWSPSSAKAGETVDGEHPASVVITNVYLQTVKNLTKGVLNTEITDLAYLTAGNRFVIANTDGTQIQTYLGGEAGASATSLGSVTSEMYYYFTIEALPALDIDEDGDNDDATYYRIAIQNASGDAKPSNWWGDNYVNLMHEWGGTIWSTTCAADKEEGYGRMGKFNAVWTVAYETGKGFKIYNPKRGKYLTVSGASDSETYLKLYQSLDLTINSEFDKENNEANDAIFAFANASGYDAGTGTLTNGGWTFDTPVDISNWDYLVITTIDNASDGSRKIKIADNDGILVEGNQYNGEAAGTVKDMYLDQWNNQNAIRISIDYLRATKGMDISKIKSLTFANNSGGGDCVLRISNVYLTDYNNTKIAGGYCAGDVKRDYAATGKFGTICLPYKASYAGAEVYSITGKTANSITLEKVTGLLEAGKPYFYMSADANGQDNGGAVRNVNFFRADLAKFDAASAGTDNGLIGTFSSTKAPLNSYVLSSNKLYQVDKDDAVTVGANKAYVNLSAITPSLARGNVFIEFDETTGIKTVKSSESMSKESVFFDLQGRRVAQPVKGMYIVNGKKVMVK